MGGPGNPFRMAFFGSPAFAVPALGAIADHHRVAVVVAQPDKPAGRGLKLRAQPVAKIALGLGLPLLQPPRLRNNTELAARLASLELDVAVTVAYGKILPAALLAIPRHGFLNVHASLLPKYRGAAPIQWALIEGETITGITIMQTEEGLDTGPIRHVRKTAIGPDDDAQTLFTRLAEQGSYALIEALELLHKGALPSEPQDDTLATSAPMLQREDGRIRWTHAAGAITNRFRGVVMWPGSWFTFGTDQVKVRALEVSSSVGLPGSVVAVEGDAITVATGEGSVRLTTVQPPGKAPMAARAWANGRGVKVGTSLG